jgi:hypothetical protein
MIRFLQNNKFICVGFCSFSRFFWFIIAWTLTATLWSFKVGILNAICAQVVSFLIQLGQQSLITSVESSSFVSARARKPANTCIGARGQQEQLEAGYRR